MRKPAVVLGVLLLVVGLVSGCGGPEKSTKSPAQRLAAAQKFLEKTDGVEIALSTPQLPPGVQGILKAAGVGTKQPAFKGEISVVQNGLSVNVPVRAVGGDVYIQFGGSWRKIDPADFGAPDPADLFKVDGGLASLLSDVEGAKAGKDTRDGKRILSTITGKIPGNRVAEVIPSASADSRVRRHVHARRHGPPDQGGADGAVLSQGRRRHLHDRLRRLRQQHHRHGPE